MQSTQPTFSILISTKNRLADLNFTLDKIDYLFQKDTIECVVFDDGSTDGTYEFLKAICIAETKCSTKPKQFMLFP
jgi:glycosyltransferase involved in cell wall biosynthesis